MDVGPSTYAAVGETRAELKQFCEELVPKWKEKRDFRGNWTGRGEPTIQSIITRTGLSRKEKRNGKQSNHLRGPKVR